MSAESSVPEYIGGIPRSLFAVGQNGKLTTDTNDVLVYDFTERSIILNFPEYVG